jgi:hypothetical protein
MSRNIRVASGTDMPNLRRSMACGNVGMAAGVDIGIDSDSHPRDGTERRRQMLDATRLLPVTRR